MTEPEDRAGPAEGPEEDEAVRRLLADLPEVAPPDGFFDDLIRTRRRRARIIAGAGLAAAGVAGAVVVAHVTGITGHVDPEMALLADRHATVLTVDVQSLRGRMEGDEVPAPYQAPEELGGMQRGTAVLHPDDVVQVVYAADGHYLSVFEQAGDMADDAMADDVTPVAVDGVDAWRTDDGAVIVRRADVVYVLMGDVADLGPETLAAIVADLPDARRLGLARRIGDAMDDLVDAFGLG